MNRPNTVTKKDLLKFIEAQPDERRIEMKEFSDVCSCGCVMVHYGREVLKKNGFGCSNLYFYPDDATSISCQLEGRITSLLPVNLKESLTYGELKKRLATESIHVEFPNYLKDPIKQNKTK